MYELLYFRDMQVNFNSLQQNNPNSVIDVQKEKSASNTVVRKSTPQRRVKYTPQSITKSATKNTTQSNQQQTHQYTRKPDLPGFKPLEPIKRQPIKRKHRPTNLLKKYNSLSKEQKKQVKKEAVSAIGFLSGSVVQFVTEIAFGVLFLNFGLAYLQKTVNGKFLINYLDKKFTSKIKDVKKIEELAGKMRREHGLENKVPIYVNNSTDAYYTPNGNHIVLGKTQLSAVYHELGHAVIENNTKFLRDLQRERGNYTNIAVGLNTIIMGHDIHQQKEAEKARNAQRPRQATAPKNSWKEKIKPYAIFIPALIPIIAYSPELITEAGASAYGLKFLNKELKAGNVSKDFVKNIRNSYITCFSTYLFLPVSIILLAGLHHLYDKVDDVNVSKKRRVKDNQLLATSTVAGAAVGAVAGLVTGAQKVAQNGQFKTEFLNTLCEEFYKNHKNLPADLKANPLLLVLRVAGRGMFDLEKMLTNENYQHLRIMVNGYNGTVAEAAQEVKEIFDEYLPKFYDPKTNKLIKNNIVTQEEKNLSDVIRKTVFNTKINALKRATWATTVTSTFAVFFYNKFKYLPIFHRKKHTNTKVQNN